jgi:hypothetical protein
MTVTRKIRNPEAQEIASMQQAEAYLDAARMLIVLRDESTSEIRTGTLNEEIARLKGLCVEFLDDADDANTERHDLMTVEV